MYHIYKNGYSTLPNLRKINNEEVFEKNHDESLLIQKEKKDALKNQTFFLEHDNEPEFYDICKNFIIQNYPFNIISNNYLDIVKELDEDFIIHRIKDDNDFMSSGHVCFPSHWTIEDKIGKNFDQIHNPVPMNLKNSQKIVKTMINNGAFERFVWSVCYEEKYNFHPRFTSKKFDIKNPEICIKVERQVTVGFPEKEFCLFILRQYLIKEKDIDKDLLKNSICQMTYEQKIYKGLENCDDLPEYLSN